MLHVRSKHGKEAGPGHEKSFSRSPETSVPKEIGADHPIVVESKTNKFSLSLSLSPESEKLREELANVAVLSLEDGYINDVDLLAVIPSIINIDLAGPITPLNDCNFLLPMSCREEVKEICKLGAFTANTKVGPCKLRISAWSAELGAMGRASGEGTWVHIWNLPLHAWCWSTILEVIRPVGELVALSQAKLPHKQFITVLVRRRGGVKLPVEIDFNLGMRRYQVLITGERGDLPVYRRDLGRFVTFRKEDVVDAGPGTGVQLEQTMPVHGPDVASGSKGMAVVERSSHAGSRHISGHQGGLGTRERSDVWPKMVVERSSHGEVVGGQSRIRFLLGGPLVLMELGDDQRVGAWLGLPSEEGLTVQGE